MSNVLFDIVDRIKAAPKQLQFLDWLFGSLKPAVLSGKPVVLFGTGNLGRDFLLTLNRNGVYPGYFSNSDASKSSCCYCGLPVISVNELKQSHRDSIIVVATQTYAADVIKNLLNNGFKRDKIVWPPDFDMATALFFTLPNQISVDTSRAHTPEEWIEVLISNKEKIAEAFKLLADEKSRQLFTAKIVTMACPENIGIFKEFIGDFSEAVRQFGLIAFQPYGPENFLYFNNDVFALSSNEIYVDVGAHDGDSVIEFVQSCVNQQVEYRHIYAFEPDPAYFQVLKKNTRHFINISCHDSAIWAKNETLRFLSSDKTTASGSSSISNTGDISVKAISLDSFLNGKQITLLKMDPPGNIMCEAIKGGAETIKEFKPKLVLGAYHSMESIFEVPLLIHELCKDYNIYLRHNSWGISETDLIAIHPGNERHR